jgi:hypothetical protein
MTVGTSNALISGTMGTVPPMSGITMGASLNFSVNSALSFFPKAESGWVLNAFTLCAAVNFTSLE